MVNLFGSANATLPQGLNIPPVSQIFELRAQGLTNNQIIDKLQRDGFKSDVISTAFSQAEARGGMVNMDVNSYGVNNPQNPMAISSGGQVPQPQDGQRNEVLVTERERIEELAEAIIDEKWNELVKSIEKIVEWKDRTESRLDKIEESMESLKTSFSDLHKGVLGKIGDYDRNITDIGSEIKALEKVFQKILPTFTENVNELTRITKELKERKI
jgi:predicted AlkP superfamily pyrophosphatase or phosphodiesterase